MQPENLGFRGGNLCVYVEGLSEESVSSLKTPVSDEVKAWIQVYTEEEEVAKLLSTVDPTVTVYGSFKPLDVEKLLEIARNYSLCKSYKVKKAAVYLFKSKRLTERIPELAEIPNIDVWGRPSHRVTLPEIPSLETVENQTL